MVSDDHHHHGRPDLLRRQSPSAAEDIMALHVNTEIMLLCNLFLLDIENVNFKYVNPSQLPQNIGSKLGIRVVCPFPTRTIRRRAHPLQISGSEKLNPFFV